MTTGNKILISSDKNRNLAIKKLSTMDLNEYEVKFIKKRDTRTLLQNKALHKYCEMLADELNGAGYGLKKVLTGKPDAEIDWSGKTVKDILWREFQRAIIDKESTTEAKRHQYSDVYQQLNRFTAEKFGISVPFPSRESMK